MQKFVLDLPASFLDDLERNLFTEHQGVNFLARLVECLVGLGRRRLNDHFSPALPSRRLWSIKRYGILKAKQLAFLLQGEVFVVLLYLLLLVQ